MDMKTIVIAVVVALVLALGVGCGTGKLSCSPTGDVNSTAQ